MPRNEIAAIVGLIVAFWWVFAGPARTRGLPRDIQGFGLLFVIFVIGFGITWIVLRLLGY
jgi:hypothetical protein